MGMGVLSPLPPPGRGEKDSVLDGMKASLMRVLLLSLGLLITTTAARADAPADAVRAAVTKGLRRIEQGSANYTTKRTCFSCHHQAPALLTFPAARQRGFTVDPARLQHQVEFTLATFRPKLDAVRQGKAVPGASTMTAYALYALEAAGHPADETTAALVQYLLVRQRADGAWPALADRPPSEGSAFTNTALALRVLKAYAPGEKDKEQQAKVDKAFAKGLAWLLANPPKTTEDKVFRLRGLVHGGADKKAADAARDLLLNEQRADGSWAQLPDLTGDAYATGGALVALRTAGVPALDPAYQKGVKFLLADQKPDG